MESLANSEYPLQRDCIRIAVVACRTLFRLGIQAMLGSSTKVTWVGSASAVAEIAGLILARAPDVLIYMLPAHELAQLDSELLTTSDGRIVPTIVMAENPTETLAYEVFHRKAKGYLSLDANEDEILDAISAVHAGRHWIPSPITELLADRVRRPALNSSEQNVLRCLGKGMADVEIAEQMGISRKTLRSYHASLLHKMGATDKLHVVLLAIVRGLVVPDPGLGLRRSSIATKAQIPS